MTVEKSNIRIYKQPEGAALDSSQKIAKYTNLFDVIQDIHELQAGNNHPKAERPYTRVSSNYGKSILVGYVRYIPCFVLFACGPS